MVTRTSCAFVRIFERLWLDDIIDNLHHEASLDTERISIKGTSTFIRTERLEKRLSLTTAVGKSTHESRRYTCSTRDRKSADAQYCSNETPNEKKS